MSQNKYYIENESSVDRYCADDYVHDCNQLPFTGPRNFKDILMVGAMLAVPILLVLLSIYFLISFL